MPIAICSSPESVTRRLAQLEGTKDLLERQKRECETRVAAADAWLKLEPDVTAALEALSANLFERVTALLREKLTIALQEVLEQPIALKVETDYKRGKATISFAIEREGKEENIMKGNGGSVANVLSVGLRLFALRTLDEKEHRRFLVLDEQDCWLRPDVVPRFVKIIHEASKALGFQVLMISHHDASVFETHADRIIRLEPGPDGVASVRIVHDREIEPGHGH